MTAGGMELGRLIMQWLDELAECSEDPVELTRRYLTPEHRQAADLIMQRMRAAGMSARLDEVGNVVGHFPAGAPAGGGSSSAPTSIRCGMRASTTARSG